MLSKIVIIVILLYYVYVYKSYGIISLNLNYLMLYLPENKNYLNLIILITIYQNTLRKIKPIHLRTHLRLTLN